MTFKTGKYDVEVGFDLYEVHGEDSITDGHRYFIQATAENGRRFVHFFTIDAPYRRQSEAAERKLNALRFRILQAQARGQWSPENNQHWTEVTPCYGSELYAANWQEYAAAERDL